MTRSPPNVKSDGVNSSPIIPTPKNTVTSTTGQTSSASTAIPKLKLSLKISQPQQAHSREHEAVRLDENTKPGLPKITLSVRKASQNEEKVTVVEPKSLLQQGPEEPVKRKRGRPPKNASINGNVNEKVAPFKETKLPSRPLPSVGRPPSSLLSQQKKMFISSSTSSSSLPLDTINNNISSNSNATTLNRMMGHANISKGPLTAHTTIGDAELAKIGRLKGHLATFIESDVETINHADYRRPFSSKQDMIERLLPFHLLSMADIQVYIPPNPTGLSMSSLADEMAQVKQSFHNLVHSQNQQAIPTELRLLEQRLCLEEEKFLLEKMRNEYKRRLHGQ